MHASTGLARTLAASAAGLALVPAAVAAADVSVEVRPDGYVWAGQRFDDLDRLAGVLLPRTPRSVGLRACGAAALPAWMTAAHRFRALELDLAVDAGGCPSPMLASPVPAGAAAAGAVDGAAAAWWALVMP